MPLSRTTSRTAVWISLLTIAALALACSGGAGPGGGSGTITLQGAGATFPNPLYQKWVSEFGKAQSNIHID